VKLGAPVSTDAIDSFAGASTIATKVFVDRGVFHLDSYPTRTAAQETNNQNGFAEVYVYPAATLSLGEGAQDFRNYLSVSVADDSRIRVVVLPENVASTWQEAVDKSRPAAFTAMEIDYTALGIDRDNKANKDHRILIEVDLTKVGSLEAGSFIPLVRADKRADHWDALHYQRESSTGQPDDLPKVTVSFPKNKDIVKDTDIKVYLNQDTWDIGIEILNDLTPPAAGEPTVDAALAVPAEDNVTKAKAGDAVELFFTIGENYDPAGITAVGAPEDWTYNPVVDNPDGYNYAVEGTMPETDVVFYLKGTTTTSGVEYKTSNITVTVESDETPVGPGPGEPDVDATLVTLTGAPESLTSGAAVSIPGTIDPAVYDVDTLAVHGVDWEIEWVDKAAGTFNLVGTAPESSATYYFTAKKLDGTEFKSSTYSLAITATPQPTPAKKSSGGGCDAGFAGLALLLGAPLFLRKRR
jgi:Synergist-CTERM protein sorting domain-containing protein